jgi:hypothetical protein
MPKQPVKSEPQRRKPGRPRTTEPGSKAIFTTLGPLVLAGFEALAESERRPQSTMAAILIEEALRARKVLK